MTEAAALIGGLGWPTVLLGMVVCFVAGLLGGLSGYGAGLLVTLFITPIVGATALVPVISVLMLINNGSRLWFYREAVDLKLVLRLSLVAIPMAWLGAQLYIRLDGRLVQVVLGAVLIASVPLRRWMKGREMHPGPGGTLAVGAVFGFLSSIIVGAGMLVPPLLLGLGYTGAAMLATDAALAVSVNFAKTVIFGALDALSLAHGLLALVMGLCTIPGTAIAAWLVKRTSVRLHMVLIESLILVGGTLMVTGMIG
jgi:uncharacterized membrane protein YfcA